MTLRKVEMAYLTSGAEIPSGQAVTFCTHLMTGVFRPEQLRLWVPTQQKGLVEGLVVEQIEIGCERFVKEAIPAQPFVAAFGQHVEFLRPALAGEYIRATIRNNGKEPATVTVGFYGIGIEEVDNADAL